MLSSCATATSTATGCRRVLERHAYVLVFGMPKWLDWLVRYARWLLEDAALHSRRIYLPGARRKQRAWNLSVHGHLLDFTWRLLGHSACLPKACMMCPPAGHFHMHDFSDAFP